MTQHTPNLFSYQRIPVAHIRPDPQNPRKRRNQDSDLELQKSMDEHGLLQPILVRPMNGGQFMIVHGERRWSGASALEWNEIDCMVFVASDSVLAMQLIENIQREDLCPEDLALHLNAMLAECQGEDNKASVRLLSAKIGKSIGWVSEKLALANLSPDVQQLKDSNQIKNSRVLIGLSKLQTENPDAAAAIIQGINEGGTVSPEVISQARGLTKKARKPAEEKPEIQLKDLPVSTPASVEPSLSEESAVPGGEAHIEPESIEASIPLADTKPRTVRKKKVLDVAKLLGMPEDMPPEDLLEAFAEAYARLAEKAALLPV